MSPQAPPPPRRRPPLARRSAPALAHHARKCGICHHPQRSDIELAFLNWDYVSSIVSEFHLPSRASLYRHARATGLLAERHRSIRGALARIIEKAQDAEPDAAAIVRAVELFARLNDDGELTLPRRSGRRSLPRFSTARAAAKSIHFRLETGATR